jgi:KDO2-lipid IV(A) lauroyltransferase
VTVTVDPPVSRDTEHETPKDRAFIVAYRALRAISRSLPEHTARALFTRAGRLAYRLAPGARAIVAENQAQVLGREPDDPLVLASTREAFALYGRFWVEAFHLVELTDEEILARVSCDTAYRLWQAHEEGKGAVLALPHIGNWDAAGRWMMALGLPLVSVAEELEPRRLYEFFVEHRRSIGIDIIGLSDANVGRKLGAALGANRMVALVADRDFGGRGIEVEMFGRTRRLPAGPALLSLMSGAPLMVTPTYQTPTGWRIHISEPLSIERTGDRRSDVEALTIQMARAFEEAIAAAPADWHMFQPGWEM